MQDVRVESQRKFADVTRALVRVENLVEFFRFLACRIDNLPVLKFKANSIETNALVNTRDIEGNITLNRISDGSGEDFAIRNIVIPPRRLRLESPLC